MSNVNRTSIPVPDLNTIRARHLQDQQEVQKLKDAEEDPQSIEASKRRLFKEEEQAFILPIIRMIRNAICQHLDAFLAEDSTNIPVNFGDEEIDLKVNKSGGVINSKMNENDFIFWQSFPKGFQENDGVFEAKLSNDNLSLRVTLDEASIVKQEDPKTGSYDFDFCCDNGGYKIDKQDPSQIFAILYSEEETPKENFPCAKIVST